MREFHHHLSFKPVDPSFLPKKINFLLILGNEIAIGSCKQSFLKFFLLGKSKAAINPRNSYLYNPPNHRHKN
jgi:hypothetical protein